MQKETVLESKNATLWYYPEEKIVHHAIHKFIYGQEFHDLLLAGTSLIKKNKAKKWLSNDTSNTVLRTEDIEWGNVNWFPQTIEAGWKYWAIVMPKAAIAKINMGKLIEDYQKAGITAKIFSDENEAFEWLKAQ